MADRQRYWKLEASEVEAFTYNESKVLNWDIKCIIGDEAEASLVGVFAYRHGTPLGYDKIQGVAYYHNHADEKTRKSVTEMLKSRFGGSPEEHSDRVLLRDSNVPYSGAAIGALARELAASLGAAVTVTLEFEGLTQEEQDAAGLPPTKLLPIVKTTSSGA